MIGGNDLGDLKSEKADAVWELSQVERKRESIRSTFIASFYADENAFRRANEGEGRAIRAALGISPDRLAFAEQHAAEISGILLEAMRETTDGSRLKKQGITFAKIGDKLRAATVESAARSLVEAMKELLIEADREPDRSAASLEPLGHLGASLGRFGGMVPAPLIAEGSRIMLESMHRASGPESLSRLGGQLTSLGEWLPKDVATGAAKLLVVRMREVPDPLQCASLGQTLAGIGDGLDASDAAEAARLLVDAMAPPNSTTEYLAYAIAKLGDKSPRAVTAEAVGKVLEAMRTTPEWGLRTYLGRGLMALAPSLTPEQAVEGCLFFARALADSGERLQLEDYASGLAKTLGTLPPDAVPKAAQAVVEAMKEAQDTGQVRRLCSALGSLGAQLPRDQATQTALVMIDWMNRTHGWRRR